MGSGSAAAEKIRVFFALKIPRDVIAGIESVLQQKLPALQEISSVPPKNWHITMHYVGMVDPELAAALSSDVQSRIKTVVPEEVAVAGFGFFMKKNPVFWLGVVDCNGFLEKLHNLTVEAGATNTGERAVSEEFHPHLTLARVTREKAAVLQKKAAQLDTYVFGRWMPSGLTLFQSKRGSSGVEYLPLYEIPFIEQQI